MTAGAPAPALTEPAWGGRTRHRPRCWSTRALTERDAVHELAELLGDSPAMQVVRDTLHRLLDRQQAGQRLPPILLQRETGTG